jgi:hypothetical protein
MSLKQDEQGAVTSVGSRGDSFDNALAESTIGLYKTELVRRRGPWRGLDDLELATLEWVDWYNHRRLHGALDHVPLPSTKRLPPHPADPDRNHSLQPPLNPGRFSEPRRRGWRHGVVRWRVAQFLLCSPASTLPGCLGWAQTSGERLPEDGGGGRDHGLVLARGGAGQPGH